RFIKCGSPSDGLDGRTRAATGKAKKITEKIEVKISAAHDGSDKVLGLFEALEPQQGAVFQRMILEVEKRSQHSRGGSVAAVTGAFGLRRSLCLMNEGETPLGQARPLPHHSLLFPVRWSRGKRLLPN